MTMTEFSAPLRGSASEPVAVSAISAGLVFDSTMKGLTLDEVSVVAVADRPVLVPLSRAIAEQSGFTVLHVEDDVLLALGVEQRRVDLPVREAFEAPTWPVESANAAGVGEVVDAGLSEPNSVGVDAIEGSENGAAGEAVVVVGVAAPGPDGPAHIAPSASPPPNVPTFTRALADLPVETARPINAITASHRDWEPESLVWPFVDRRTEELTPVESTLGAAPRSLSSGRPVNGGEAAELLISIDRPPARSIIVDLDAAMVPALRPLTLQIHSGSFVVVTGDRGSGKTSLLRLLAGFEPPMSGRAVVDSVDLGPLDDDDRAVREAVSDGFLPQMPFLVPDLTVEENVELPLLAAGVSALLARGAAEEATRRVGLGRQIGLPASVLSGSEVRLAALARALVNNPEMILADEPFAGLCDADAAEMILRFRALVDEGATVIVACTDPRVRLLGVRHIVLDRGAVVRDDERATTLV